MSTPPAERPEPQDAQMYELRVAGRLDARWAARLGVSHLTHESDGTTTLRSIAVDQPALHGLLQRVRDLGMALVSVTRVGADTPILNPDTTEPRNPAK